MSCSMQGDVQTSRSDASAALPADSPLVAEMLRLLTSSPTLLSGVNDSAVLDRGIFGKSIFL